MYYSDVEFVEKVNDKLGNVKYFKKRLRGLDLVGSRQKLSDDYVPIFEEVKSYKEKNNSTWEMAMDEVLPKYADNTEIDSEDDDLLSVMKEVLITLKKIEQKL